VSVPLWRKFIGPLAALEPGKPVKQNKTLIFIPRILGISLGAYKLLAGETMTFLWVGYELLQCLALL